MTRQLSLEDWPNGLDNDSLHVSLEPSEISRRTKVNFSRDHDSLDDFDAAVVDLGEGRAFVLQSYLRSPVAGTTVLLKPETVEALEQLIAFLQLRKQDVIWAAPHVERALERVYRKQKRRSRVGLPATFATRRARAALGRSRSEWSRDRKLRVRCLAQFA